MVAASQTNSWRILLGICYLAFVSLGLPDPLIGVAWPSVRENFNLQQSQVSAIFFGNGCSYFLSSFFAGRLLKLLNVGLILAVSSGLVAVSAFNYGIATLWPWFALGALFHGLGSGAIDAGLNHYVASHFSARHMNWLHASYSFGAMLGPAIMTACIAQAGQWRLAYLIVATILAMLALLFLVTNSRWRDGHLKNRAGIEELELAKEAPGATPLKEADSTSASFFAGWVFRHRLVQLSVIVFFIYTGLEVALGQWSFTVLTEARGIPAKTAGTWVTIYWGSILAGRILFGFIVDQVRIDLLIRLSLMTALSGTLLFAADPFFGSALLALALCGLGLAVIFPCLMTRTPQRLGKDLAAHAIGFQVGGAMLGAAALPSACGLLAQYLGLKTVAPALFGIAATLLILHEILVVNTPKELRAGERNTRAADV